MIAGPAERRKRPAGWPDTSLHACSTVRCEAVLHLNVYELSVLLRVPAAHCPAYHAGEVRLEDPESHTTHSVLKGRTRASTPQLPSALEAAHAHVMTCIPIVR